MRRAVVAILVDEHAHSVVSACRIAGRSRTAFYRPSQAMGDADAPIIAALTTVIAQDGRWGFWSCRNRLRDLGHLWNHERICRVHCALPLNQVRRTNEADVSWPSERVVAVREQLVAMHGAPRRIRCVNVLHPLSSVKWARTRTEACVEPAPPLSAESDLTRPVSLSTVCLTGKLTEAPIATKAVGTGRSSRALRGGRAASPCPVVCDAGNGAEVKRREAAACWSIACGSLLT